MRGSRGSQRRHKATGPGNISVDEALAAITRKRPRSNDAQPIRPRPPTATFTRQMPSGQSSDAHPPGLRMPASDQHANTDYIQPSTPVSAVSNSDVSSQLHCPKQSNSGRETSARSDEVPTPESDATAPAAPSAKPRINNTTVSAYGAHVDVVSAICSTHPIFTATKRQKRAFPHSPCSRSSRRITGA